MAVQDPVRWFRRQTAPITIALCILFAIGCVLTQATGQIFFHATSFDGSPFPRFWTLFTYPFIGSPSLLTNLFQGFWLYWVGSMLESDHRGKFLYVWLFASVIGVLPLALFHFSALGMFIPMTILTTIWGTRNPNLTVMVFMVIPVPAKIIAILAVIGQFYLYSGGMSQPFIGLAAISMCILGFLYARNMIPGFAYGHGAMLPKAKSNRPSYTRAQVVREEDYYEDVHRREKDREERERLRKLFEGSLEDNK